MLGSAALPHLLPQPLHYRRLHPLWSLRPRVEQHPLRFGFAQQHVIRNPLNAHEALAMGAANLADPGSAAQLLPGEGGAMVADMVFQHHPDISLPLARRIRRKPVRAGCVLHPAHVLHVISVTKLVNISVGNGEGAGEAEGRGEIIFHHAV